MLRLATFPARWARPYKIAHYGHSRAAVFGRFADVRLGHSRHADYDRPVYPGSYEVSICSCWLVRLSSFLLIDFDACDLPAMKGRSHGGGNVTGLPVFPLGKGELAGAEM